MLLEALRFLKVNRSLWDVYDVGVAMGRIEMVGTAGGGMADNDNEEDKYIELIYLNDQYYYGVALSLVWTICLS